MAVKFNAGEVLWVDPDHIRFISSTRENTDGKTAIFMEHFGCPVEGTVEEVYNAIEEHQNRS